MFSFFKKKSETTIVPEWASFFTEKEYSFFMNQIDEYFKKLNVQYEIGDGQVNVSDNAFGFDILGLTNLAQFCKQEDRRHYKEIIAGHYNSLIRANEFDQEFEKIQDKFEEVEKYIGVRLYDNEYVDNIGKENTIGRDFAGNIYAMIVFDFPDSVVNIKPNQTKAWNKTIDELFEIGVSNIKSKYPFTISKQAFKKFSIWFVQGEHFFTPNIVFEMENIKELIGSKGSLVGLPHRHSAIIYPIENLEVVTAINVLIPTIYGMNKEGPGSLSNNLFWYDNNTFTHLPYQLDEGKLEFFPPDKFVEVINDMK